MAVCLSAKPPYSVTALARFLVAGIYGLRVFNKTQPDISALKSIVDNLLFVLRGKSCNDGA